jgi:hypothetical protein
MSVGAGVETKTQRRGWSALPVRSSSFGSAGGRALAARVGLHVPPLLARGLGDTLFVLRQVVDLDF